MPLVTDLPLLGDASNSVYIVADAADSYNVKRMAVGTLATYIASPGTHTPSPASETNLSATTCAMRYLATPTQVFFSLYGTATIAAGSSHSFIIDLPAGAAPATNFDGTAGEGGGMVSSYISTTAQPGYISANSGAKTMTVVILGATTGSATYHASGFYRI